MGTGCSRLPQGEEGAAAAPAEPQHPPQPTSDSSSAVRSETTAPVQIVTTLYYFRSPTSAVCGEQASSNVSEFRDVVSVASPGSERLSTVGDEVMSEGSVPVVRDVIRATRIQRQAPATDDGSAARDPLVFLTADSTRTFDSLQSPGKPRKRRTAIPTPISFVPSSATTSDTHSPPLHGNDGQQILPTPPRSPRTRSGTTGRYSDITVTFISLNRRK